ncbi:MAG: HupE/UreJ family protein [Nitrosomonadales bacterium]|nr:HupE/UreJ family protein [Nitrosomonadales bacterium]
MRKSVFLYPILCIVAGLFPSSFAYAHTVVAEAGSFMQGFMHPFSGMDHVCAMVAVGLWATQLGGRSVWAVPFTFVAVMALGSVLPMMGISLPLVEQGVALSVLVLGVLIFALIRLPTGLSASLVGLFALWHGHAHGNEMPGSVAVMKYLFGFMLSTAVLHGVGIMLGLWMRRFSQRKQIFHCAGAGIALCGMWLVIF